MTSRLAIAATSELAAQAGAHVADAGGNAVDAAIAAILVSINTEPGICSIACGGYVTIWPPGGAPITLDGYVTAPGLGSTLPASERNSWDVHMLYGGGVTTTIGPDSVGVPGGVALFGLASRGYGNIPWRVLLEPAVAATRAGFPLPAASLHYLEHSAEPIFGQTADGRAALYHEDGRLKRIGETIRVPHLAETLERIGRNGPDEFYTGDIGRAIAEHMHDNGGRLNATDLANYTVERRPSLIIDSGSASRAWQIATNPPPAVGGIVLAAMLKMANRTTIDRWDAQAVKTIVDIQRIALGYRRERLDLTDDIDGDAERLLELAATCDAASALQSGSTCHASAIDDSGLACAVTVSSGYSSGDMPDGTGIWLNNCLGEIELNKRGLDIGPPGTRLPSNMAPTAARAADGTTLAIGSPGADRITTAILQALVGYLQIGLPLDEAVRLPRAHVEFADEGVRVACEPGLPVDAIDIPQRHFDALSMYFGGVSGAAWSPEDGFTVAADPRRTGGTWFHS
jgi:gamma-glutamyltranspeptidase/glutathione hydrolase